MLAPHVVILGGGFGGLVASRKLPRSFSVTVVDQRADFEWLPNIHEVVSRRKKPSSLQIPRGKVVQRHKHTFLQASVDGIDRSARKVHLSDGQRLPYDFLIVALGARSASRGVPGIDHALPFRSVDEAVAVRDRLRALADDKGSRSVTILGGGFVGVEVLGEILRRYRTRSNLHINIIEPQRRLLDDLPKVVHRSIRDAVRDLNVDIYTGKSVSAVEEDHIRLASGERIRSDLTIQAMGTTTLPLLAESGLATGARRAPVQPTLLSQRDERVFVIGDAARFSWTITQQGYHAQDMGRRAANNIRRIVEGREPKRFKPQKEQQVITFGDLDAFWAYDGEVVSGAALGLMRELIFQQGILRVDKPTKKGAKKRMRRRIESSLDGQLSESLKVWRRVLKGKDPEGMFARLRPLRFPMSPW